VDGTTLYRFAEALDQAQISRSTFFRWVKDGRIPDVRFRDRNNGRLMTQEELESLKALSLKVIDTRQPQTQTLPFRVRRSRIPGDQAEVSQG
jgi:hypothetical protein